MTGDNSHQYDDDGEVTEDGDCDTGDSWIIMLMIMVMVIMVMVMMKMRVMLVTHSSVVCLQCCAALFILSSHSDGQHL